MSNLLVYDSLKYDDYLKRLLQKNVVFVLDNKIIRRGQIVLYSYKNFSIQFHIKQNNNTRKTDIPIPFGIKEVNNNSLLFDYTYSIILEDNIDIKHKNNKFFNQQLQIKIE